MMQAELEINYIEPHIRLPCKIVGLDYSYNSVNTVELIFPFSVEEMLNLFEQCKQAYREIINDNNMVFGLFTAVLHLKDNTGTIQGYYYLDIKHYFVRLIDEKTYVVLKC